MPATPLSLRLKTLQTRIRSWKSDALLVTNPNDIRYLTGFVGHDSWALVPAHAAKTHVISDFRFHEQIKKEAPAAIAHIRKGSICDELALVASKLRLRKIALQSNHATLTQLKQLQTKVPRARFKPVADDLLDQRAVKSPDEITAIKKAIAIQQQAFRTTIAWITPGQTESQIAAYLEYQMRLLGAEGTSFPSIIAADSNASLPHAIPGRRKIKKGGALLIDWGARYNGYCSDMTRVVALGKMPTQIQEIYNIVLDAQLAAIAAVKPGQKLKDVDAAARRVIAKAGYADHFGHGTGHGIGLDIHEHPTLSKTSKGTLLPGHVVTVEPGIYLPGIGGVRIEDDVLVTTRGQQVLSNLPKDLKSTII